VTVNTRIFLLDLSVIREWPFFGSVTREKRKI